MTYPENRQDRMKRLKQDSKARSKAIYGKIGEKRKEIRKDRAERKMTGLKIM